MRGGGGKKKEGIQISRYKGTCTKMSHEQMKQVTKQTNLHQSEYASTDLSTEVSNTFVIVTAHKQVCANQQSHQVSFDLKLNHKQRSRQAAHLFLQTRIWVGFFLARGLVCKRCWIRLAVNRIRNFGFRVGFMFKTFGRLNVKQGH